MDKYFSRINQHIICLILCVAMFSCMGESGTIVKFGSQAGVVRLADGKQIHLRNGMTLEAQELDTLAVKDADCCLVDFQINYDTQTDTLQGIWHTDWLIYKPVPKWKQLMLTEPDTMIRADEHFLDFDIPKGGFVSNHLFLYMEYGSHYQTQVEFVPDEFPSCRRACIYCRQQPEGLSSLSALVWLDCRERFGYGAEGAASGIRPY